jgi:hypothetical protein
MLVVMFLVINYGDRMCLGEGGVREWGRRHFLIVISTDCGISCFGPSGSATNAIVTFFVSNTFLFNQLPIDICITIFPGP